MAEKNSILTRLKDAWNVFSGRDPTRYRPNLGASSSYRPDRVRLSRGNERSIVTAVYNRIAIDASSINIQHVRLDKDKRYVEDMDSDLNNCLTVEANIDQSARAFRLDMYLSMLDEGCIAIVPVDTEDDPDNPGSTKIYTMRVGKVVEWFPRHVRVDLYNDRTGRREEVVVPKTSVGIVENPFYAIMNEPNSILQRLVRKLNLLDVIDEQSGSGKLDIIIQLPYTVKGELKRQQAEQRRKDIIDQLTNSKYGIAYTDSTEHITQLNRPVENNLMKQIEYLTSMLYSQLGISQEILDGSANEETMLNYYNRTIEPIVAVIAEEMKRKFITKTARTQGQSIEYYRDPLKLVPVKELAAIASQLTSAEVLSSNEVRSTIGFKPSKDPRADQLVNKNINKTEGNGGGSNSGNGDSNSPQNGEKKPLLSEKTLKRETDGKKKKEENSE